MGRWKRFISGLFDRKVDAIGLSVFRILYCSVLLCQVIRLFNIRHIVYDKEPFSYIGEIDVKFLFIFWIAIVIFLIFGAFTRFSTIVNYMFSVIIFSSAERFEYHVFYAYVGMNFVMMFLPVSRVLSIDSLIKKVRYTSIGRPFRVDRTILEINYLIPVFVVIGLVYFDSIFLKIDSKMWGSGLGVWLPSSMPMITWVDTSLMLDQKELIVLLGYFVLFFETVFIFLFWFRKMRLSLFFIGFFFHVGILIAYPIPWFALAFIAVYTLLIPAVFWRKISNRIKSKNPSYAFYYDAECPLCNKVVVVIRHIDIFNKVACLTVQGNYQDQRALDGFDEETLLINIHGVTQSGKVKVGFQAYVQLFKSMVYLWPIGFLLSVPGISHLGKKVYNYIAGDRLTVRCTEENCTLPVVNLPLDETQDIMVKGWNRLHITKVFWKLVILFFTAAQLMLIWFKPHVQRIIDPPAIVNRIADVPFRHTKDFLVDYFGITDHSVFLDSHFENYNHTIRVLYDDHGKFYELPFYDENGMPRRFNMGAIWRNLSFNVITSRISREKLEYGIVPYLNYYIDDENLDQDSYTFRFYVKELETPKHWERAYLKKGEKKPWKFVGTCTIGDGAATFNWNDAMTALEDQEKATHGR